MHFQCDQGSPTIPSKPPGSHTCSICNQITVFAAPHLMESVKSLIYNLQRCSSGEWFDVPANIDATSLALALLLILKVFASRKSIDDNIWQAWLHSPQPSHHNIPSSSFLLYRKSYSDFSMHRFDQAVKDYQHPSQILRGISINCSQKSSLPVLPSQKRLKPMSPYRPVIFSIYEDLMLLQHKLE